MRTIVCILIGYTFAAMISQHVSFDIRETDWYNLWTYIWIVFSFPFTLLCLGLFFAACASLASR